MARVKRGTTTRAKHNRILDAAKGYYGRRKNTIRIARQAVALAGNAVLHLAGGGELEALFHAALRLQLGHFVSFSRAIKNGHGSPY